MFKAIDLFDEKTSNSLQLGEKRNALMKIVNEFNIFSSKAFNNRKIPDIPVLDFELDKKNIEYIDNVIARSIDQTSNVYSLGPFISIYDNDFVEDTETKILFGGKEFDAKIKLHGVADDNWINPKKSFSIKTSKSDYLNNSRRFKLIIFEEQFLQTILASRLASLLGYIELDTEIVKLRFNGIDQGYYLLEEALSKELLEKNKLPGVDVIKGFDEWTHQYKSGHLTLFSHEISNQDYSNYSSRDVGQLLMFNELMEAQTFEEIKDLVDLEKFALHEAMRILFATDQAITGDNIKWLFDTTSGKFFPYFRMEGYLNELPTSERSYTFDKDLNEWFWFDYDIKVFPILNRNDGFRALRNKYLHEILINRDVIESFYASLFEKYGQIPLVDTTNNYPARWYSRKINDSISALSNNFDYIEKYLNYSKVYSTLTQINNKEFILEIIPDSNSTINIDRFYINGIDMSKTYEIINLLNSKSASRVTTLDNYFMDKEFSLSLDDSLEVEKNVYQFKIKSADVLDIEDYEISFNNSITGKRVLEREIYTKFIKTPEKLLIKNNKLAFNPDTFLNKYPHAIIKDKTIIFNKGDYIFDEDFEFPQEYDIEIRAGSKLFLSHKKSILIHGNLTILGAKDEVVKISNLKNGNPFGVFAAVGDGKTIIEISGLELSGGSEDVVSGIYLSGALSLYHHDKVKLVNSSINNNYADDGLNVKNANIFIKNNSFSDNFADQVDLDFVSGQVLNNNFVAKTKFESTIQYEESSNGDGLDLSGSKVIIKNNTSIGFPDKGFSIGEKSDALVVNNLFNKNRSAITIKDESSVYLFENQYNLNDIDVEMYQKKQIFGEPLLYLLNNENILFKVDKSPLSKVYTSTFNKEQIDILEEFDDFESSLTFLKKNEWVEK